MRGSAAAPSGSSPKQADADSAGGWSEHGTVRCVSHLFGVRNVAQAPLPSNDQSLPCHDSHSAA